MVRLTGGPGGGDKGRAATLRDGAAAGGSRFTGLSKFRVPSRGGGDGMLSTVVLALGACALPGSVIPPRVIPPKSEGGGEAELGACAVPGRVIPPRMEGGGGTEPAHGESTPVSAC